MANFRYVANFRPLTLSASSTDTPSQNEQNALIFGLTLNVSTISCNLKRLISESIGLEHIDLMHTIHYNI